MREALKKARIDKGLSVEDVAEKIGVTPSVYYKWEDGTRDPLMKNAKKVAETLEKNVEELFFSTKLDKTSSEVA